MEDERVQQLIAANSNALRKVAAMLEAMATLVEATGKVGRTEKPVVTDMSTTRKMPAMEAQALALDEAVRGVARAIEKLEPLDSMRRVATPSEIPLPEVTTVKITRPEQMLELIGKMPSPPQMPAEMPPGTIVEVDPVEGPITQKIGSADVPPGVRNPRSFGRSHPK